MSITSHAIPRALELGDLGCHVSVSHFALFLFLTRALPIGAPIPMGSPSSSEPTFAQLSVRGLTRSVQGRVILSQLSFSVSSGDTVFITGPSGVGKSLLLRTLSYLGERAAAPAAAPAAAAVWQLNNQTPVLLSPPSLAPPLQTRLTPAPSRSRARHQRSGACPSGGRWSHTSIRCPPGRAAGACLPPAHCHQLLPTSLLVSLGLLPHPYLWAIDSCLLPPCVCVVCSRGCSTRAHLQSSTLLSSSSSHRWVAAQEGGQYRGCRLGKGLRLHVHQHRLPAAAPAALHPAAFAATALPLLPLSLQRGRPRGDLPALVHQLGLEQAVLNQPWVELSVRCLPACPAILPRHPARPPARPPACLPACLHLLNLNSR